MGLLIAACSPPSSPRFHDPSETSIGEEDATSSEGSAPDPDTTASTSTSTTGDQDGSTSDADASTGTPSDDDSTGSSTGSTTGTSTTGAPDDDGEDESSEGSDTDAVEVCDGIDNDGNGIIDDVDVGGDGVCDCIRIATLGLAGQWGDGDIFAQWLSSRATQGATDLADEVLTPELLEPFQVIVVQNVSTIGRSYGEDEIEALRGWVEGGGGLMTLIGYGNVSELANVNLLLEPFDLAYRPQAILPKSGGVTVPISEWEPHPVTTGVTAVGVDNGYPVSGDGLVYARERGYDVGIAAERGSGRISVWGDEWITYDSEWVDRPEYQVELFWLNSIKWLTPPLECQVVVPVPS